MCWSRWSLPDQCSCERRTLATLLLLASAISVLGIDCSRTIVGLVGNESDGVIQSPGFPESYPTLGEQYTCKYSLQIIGEGYITLSFDDFHLDDTIVYTCKNNGTYDYLTINLHDNQSPLYHCGIGRPPAIIAPKNMVTLELVVHPKSSSTSFRGFRMNYKFIPEETKTELSNTFHDEETIIPTYTYDEGSFSIPRVRPLESPYSSQSIHVIWYITAPMENQRIQLSVTDFQPPPYVAAPMVLITDGPTSHSGALLSGANVNAGPLYSTQRYMFVQLKGAVAAGISFRANFSFFSDLLDTGECPDGLRNCRRSQQCIRPNLFCNGRSNCGQEQDEWSCNSLCEPNPCENGGMCRASADYFSCTCTKAFTGPLCAKPKTVTTVVIPTCAGACFNGGQCVNGECNCPTNYIGSRCEFPISNNTVPDLENTSIMIGAFVGAVCLLSICWLVAMARKRYTEQEEGQLPPGQRPPQRMISIHSPEELGLSRSVTSGPEDLDIPPDYSEVFLEDDKPAHHIIPISEPTTQPPSYDLVTDSDDGGIIIDCTPHSTVSGSLPDIIEVENDSPGAEPSSPETGGEEGSVSRRTSHSTDV